MNMIQQIYVLVPARNEEKLLPRCLRSILKSCHFLEPNIKTEIILTVDASSDRTFRIGHDLLGDRGGVIFLNKANVGCARKLAASVALSRYTSKLNECWIANTDADCVVPANWLASQIAHAKNGVQGIAGIVKVDSFKEHEPHVPRKFKDSYTIYADYSHPHIHGANMGFRADAYVQAGGWPELETAEDHALWNRFIKLGTPIIADANIWVYTSGRRHGRAPHGFADTLSRHNEFSHD